MDVAKTVVRRDGAQLVAAADRGDWSRHAETMLRAVTAERRQVPSRGPSVRARLRAICGAPWNVVRGVGRHVRAPWHLVRAIGRRLRAAWLRAREALPSVLVRLRRMVAAAIAAPAAVALLFALVLLVIAPAHVQVASKPAASEPPAVAQRQVQRPQPERARTTSKPRPPAKASKRHVRWDPNALFFEKH